jgi:putative endopeptidase
MRTYCFRDRITSVRAVIVVVATFLTVGALCAESTHAIDPSAIDTKADPRIDFSRYASGAWFDRVTIADDSTDTSSFDEIDKPLSKQLLGLVSAPQTSPNGKQAARLFAQGMDMELRNGSAFSPVRPALDAINKAKSLGALSSTINKSYTATLYGPLSFAVQPFADDPNVNGLYVGAPPLGLSFGSSYDYYLGQSVELKQIRAFYVANMAAQLELAGYSKIRARSGATGVLKLETDIVRLLIDPRKLESSNTIAVNPYPFAAVQKKAPLVNWAGVFANSSIRPTDTVIVSEPGYLDGAAKLFRRTPLRAVQAFYTIQVLRNSGPFLHQEIGDLQFQFISKLAGITARRPLEERVLSQTNGLLPDALGQLYVEKYFSPEAKTEITNITKEVMAAFGKRITANTWMTEATKARAVEKLNKIKINVGYPDRWINYESIQFGPTYFDTVDAISTYIVDKAFASIGKAVDNSNWGPVPQVNAFYNPQNNSINFPAGILAGVFFDPKNDAAANFGAIGAVIGHEMTHGFDLQGSQYDGDGKLTDWWTDADRRQFEALNARLAKQYSAIKVGDLGNVNGRLTVTENLADLGGLVAAYDALQARLATIPGPGLIDGLTQNQRFFVAIAQVWKTKERPEYTKLLLTQDVHAPGAIRATQPLRNVGAFYDAFGVKDGDPMWLAPGDRVSIW